LTRLWAKTPCPHQIVAPCLHLGATLDELNIPKADQDELIGLILPMRDDIVEVESPETGTPLPDSYQVAPPLS
jgi:hemoglobin